MEFSNNRDPRRVTTAGQPVSNQQPSGVGGGHLPVEHRTGKHRKGGSLSLRTASVVLLFSATILVVALLVYLVFGSPKNENEYVDKTKLQAVFLNGGQVYFGKIQKLNNQYLSLNNIYYLRLNQAVQPNGETQTGTPELVRLGCELHRPQDTMLINRDQVIFWENLKEDGSEATVPGAIKKYEQDNAGKPNECAEPQQQSQNQEAQPAQNQPADTKKNN